MSLKSSSCVHVHLCGMNARECVHAPVCVHVCAVEYACMWKLEVQFGHLPCLLSTPVLWQNLLKNPEFTDLATLARQFAPEIPSSPVPECWVHRPTVMPFGDLHRCKPFSPSSYIFIHLNSFLKLKNGPFIPVKTQTKGCVSMCTYTYFLIY